MKFNKIFFIILFLISFIPLVVFAGGSNEDAVVTSAVKCQYELVVPVNNTATSDDKVNDFKITDLNVIILNYNNDEHDIKFEIYDKNGNGKEWKGTFDNNFKGANQVSGYGLFSIFDKDLYYDNYNKASSCPMIYSYKVTAGSRIDIASIEQTSYEYNAYAERKYEAKSKYSSSNGVDWTLENNEVVDDIDTKVCEYNFGSDFGIATNNFHLNFHLKLEKIVNKTQNITSYNLFLKDKDVVNSPENSFYDILNGPLEFFQYPVSDRDLDLYISSETVKAIIDGTDCLAADKIYSFYGREDIGGTQVVTITADLDEAYASGENVYNGDSSIVNLPEKFEDRLPILIDRFMNNIDITTCDCTTYTLPYQFDECQKKQKKDFDELLSLRHGCQKIYSNLDLSESSKAYTKCKEFEGQVKIWATNRCFGNRLITSNGNNDCTGTLGSLGVWLSKIYNILKLAVPAIIVAMGFKDFIQGMASGKDDALKKAGTSFIKRLVVGAIFVMLPLLIKMILTFAFGGGFSDICIDL